MTELTLPLLHQNVVNVTVPGQAQASPEEQ